MDVNQATALLADAYVYGYPVVDCHTMICKQVLDTDGPDFRAPFNRIAHARTPATPADRGVVAPNADTPYSYLWFDLRAEPMVVTLPPFEPGRYVSMQLNDLYTYIVGYVTPRTNGNAGGDFLVAGPDWQGPVPAGVKKVFSVPTQIAFALFRTQLFGPQDLANVHAIQDGFGVRPLSEYLDTPSPPAPAPAPFVRIEPVDVRKDTESLHYFTVLDAMLRYMPPLDDELELRERCASVGLGAGTPLTGESLGAAGVSGMQLGLGRIYERAKTVRSSAELFGSREYLGRDYVTRAAGALLGIFGNSAEEYLGVGWQGDGDGKSFDGANRYTIRFEADKMPPVEAFWSITVYTEDKFLYPNEIDRYVINSAAVPSLNRDEDGSFTLYVQHESPGADLEANWLPAPAASFGLTFRCYQPEDALISGAWQAPPVVPVG